MCSRENREEVRRLQPKYEACGGDEEEEGRREEGGSSARSSRVAEEGRRLEGECETVRERCRTAANARREKREAVAAQVIAGPEGKEEGTTPSSRGKEKVFLESSSFHHHLSVTCTA